MAQFFCLLLSIGLILVAKQLPLLLAECERSNEIDHDGRPVYYAKFCKKTECTLPRKVFSPCTVTNMKNSLPGACLQEKTQLMNRTMPSSENAFKKAKDVCFAKLANISLFDFSCKMINVEDSVSLSFSFFLPHCDEQSLTENKKVMVDFVARNDSLDRYFREHPICRVFDFSNANFTEEAILDKYQITYDCMGMGLLEGFPSIYYYLSFTNLPSGVSLNYTIAFYDENKDSLRLVAGAWLPGNHIHIVFLPIQGIASYRIQAKSGKWEDSITTQIPNLEIYVPDVNFVAVTVTALGNSLNIKRPNITVQLFKRNSIFLPVDKTDPKLFQDPMPDQGDKTRIPVLIGVMAALIIILATLFAVRHKVQKSKQHPPKAKKKIFVIGELSHFIDDTEKIQHGFEVMKMNTLQNRFHIMLGKKTPVSLILNKIFNADIILFVLSANDSDDFRETVEKVFGYRTLWDRVRVAMVCTDRNEQKPSVFFQERCPIATANYSVFLKHLDNDNKHFFLPQDKFKLIKSLTQVEKIKDDCAPLLPENCSGNHYPRESVGDIHNTDVKRKLEPSVNQTVYRQPTELSTNRNISFKELLAKEDKEMKVKHDPFKNSPDEETSLKMLSTEHQQEMYCDSLEPCQLREAPDPQVKHGPGYTEIKGGVDSYSLRSFQTENNSHMFRKSSQSSGWEHHRSNNACIQSSQRKATENSLHTSDSGIRQSYSQSGFSNTLPHSQNQFRNAVLGNSFQAQHVLLRESAQNGTNRGRREESMQNFILALPELTNEQRQPEQMMRH